MASTGSAGRDWADEYLADKLEGSKSEASAEHGPPPEASDYMDDLTDADLTYVHPDNRADHLETAVRALVRALAQEETVTVTDGRPASAFVEDGRVIVTMEGLGEVINVDHETAALLAFAYERPAPTMEES
ncbi:hypothetical protein HWV23_09075 [Natronomonas halophila]|uniref:hypothetical protein n=1 Tax=Natronomonas halophila TaxID=2747817 RepID=UPI0015B69CA0|nr:hypothetical protein [Natronomonas halophila]QLD85870.1 hypothetical protein HWV23_09075 [Natronomonas halophila]